ncbi:uncharacterized protein [Temnothorax longispinosus]|uniref:uncharacterized protein n=1 Tax=Temnothorax longispinosus TaxID=300112 RepID=UPI003A99117E
MRELTTREDSLRGGGDLPGRGIGRQRNNFANQRSNVADIIPLLRIGVDNNGTSCTLRTRRNKGPKKRVKASCSPERKISSAYKQSIHLTMRGSRCVQGRCITDQRAPAARELPSGELIISPKGSNSK